MNPQPPVTRIRTAPDTSSATDVKPHTTNTKDTTVATISENQVAKLILDAAFLVHTKLGPGVFESVYEVVLPHESGKMGLAVEPQKPMSIQYDGIQFNEAFRPDLVVNEKVVGEPKSVAALADIHVKQVLTQLRWSGLNLGLLINFGANHLKDGIKRIINGRLEPAEISDLEL